MDDVESVLKNIDPELYERLMSHKGDLIGDMCQQLLIAVTQAVTQAATCLGDESPQAIHDVLKAQYLIWKDSFEMHGIKVVGAFDA